MITVSNKQLAKVFREAGKYLKEHYYICRAINAAYDNGRASEEACSHAIEIVHQRIDQRTFASGWVRSQLIKQHGVRQGERLYTEVDMHAWRKTWLKSLAEEFNQYAKEESQ